MTESVATNPIYGLHPQDVGHANTALDRGHINAACDIRETNVDVEMRQTRRSEGKLDRTEELDEFDKLSSERDTGPSKCDHVLQLEPETCTAPRECSQIKGALDGGGGGS